MGVKYVHKIEFINQLQTEMPRVTRADFFFTTLILVAVTLPFSNLMVNTLSIWLMVASWAITGPIKDKILLLRSNKLIWLFSLLFILYSMGLIYGDFNLGLFEVEKRLSLFIFPIVLGTAPQINSKKLKTILVSFSISCIAISLLCLIDMFHSNHSLGIPYGYYITHGYISNYFGFHQTYFSIYSVLSVFILLYVLLKNKDKSQFRNLFLVFGIVYLIFFILLLGSRVGFISLLGLFVVSFLLYSYKKRKLLYGIAVAFLFIFTTSFAIQFFNPIKEKLKSLVSSSKENSQYNSSERLELWESTFEVIKGNLLLGVGTGDLQPALQKIYKIDSKAYNNHLNSHNQFLDIAATFGIIGLIIFLLCLFYPIYLCYVNDKYLYAIFIMLFVFLSLVECPLAMQKGVIWYAFFNSLFAFHRLETL